MTYGMNGWNKEILEQLPAAQPELPERLTDDDFETIRIHLNAHNFINYIEDYKYCPNCGADMRETWEVKK